MKYAVVHTLILTLALASASAFELRVAANETRNPAIYEVEKENRITNGNTAWEGQFPYQVGLALFINSHVSHWCGGSLISTTCILTAAHCVDGVQSLTAYLGATKRWDAEDTRTVYKNNIIIHPRWDSSSLMNDIALIKIPQVALSRRIQIVALPTNVPSYPTYPSYAGEYAIASGWGQMSERPSTASILQWGRMQILSNDQCARYYPNMFKNGHICISTKGGVSTCYGDSGGPLVLESSKVQVGLTSFGTAAGCTMGYPAVFTRITSYLNWIRANQ